MKKSLFTMVATSAIAVMFLSACSQDTILEQPESVNTVTHVSLVARNINSSYDVVSFHFNSGAESYYAYAPKSSANVKAEISLNRQSLNVSVPSSVNGTQEDIVAAKAENVYPTSVSLDFQHLLAQVKIEAKTDCAALHIDVKSIGIENIYSEGSYDYSSNSWTLDSDSKGGSYYKTVGQTINTETVGLTGESALLLIPQSGVSAWTKSSTNTGARIAIVCKMKDNSGYQFFPSTSDPSNDADGYATVYVPVQPNWTAGASYTYTIMFGDSRTATAVYTSNGESVLEGSGITFDPTVTGWTNAGSSTNM
jgi:hypothetical protein